MNAIIGRVVVLICGFFIFEGLVTEQAHAQCVSPEYQQRNATQSYMIRFTEIGYVPVGVDEYAQARIDTRGARFEVLKVYSGDVDSLKDLQNAMLTVQCNNQTGPNCRVLEERNYPFRVGQRLIVYAKPDEDGVIRLTMGSCPGSWRVISDKVDLLKFERYYPPLWESEAWEREQELIRMIDPTHQ